MTSQCTHCGGPLLDEVCQNPTCPSRQNVPEFSDSVGGFRENYPATRELPARGPLLSLEQAALPIDHTGTIMFEKNADPLQTRDEVLPGLGATRLTDDENYRVIQTVLKESISSAAFSDDLIETANPQSEKTAPKATPGGLTDRPEVSATIQLREPFEEGRTLQRLPSRSLSVPEDSASLERRKKKKKKKEDAYSLDSKDYKIVSKIGEGGSGVVYEASQIALKRKVAIKVLKQRRVLSGSRSRTSLKEVEKRKARFMHEVYITGKLQHPNIIPLYDLGVNHHGEVFYSMKLINENADERVQQSWASLVRSSDIGSFTAVVERNVEIFEKVCDAMRFAHAEKIVHRDLKPDNVMVGKFGEVLVIDWGMALDLSKGPEPFTAGGTTSYMAPEMGLHYLKQSEMHQLSHSLMVELGEERRELFVEAVLDRGNLAAATELLDDESLSEEVHDICRELIRLDGEEKVLAEQINLSSDIYLLGAILYEIAVGHPPHFVPQESCKNIEEKHHREFWLSSNHRIQRLVKIEDPLRLSLCNIALGALQKNQEDRFQSIDEFQDALKGFQNQVQSLQLVEQGRSELKKAQGGVGYLHLLPALESFRGANTLFPLGTEAQHLQIETACEYAKRADRRKDFDAGLSILDEYVLEESKSDPAVATLNETLKTGKRRAARNRRLAAVGWVAACVLPIGVWVASMMATAQMRTENANLAMQNQTLETQTETANEELNSKLAELADQEKTLIAKNSELAEKDQVLVAKTEQLDLKTVELDTKTTELTEKTNLLKKNQVDLMEQQNVLRKQDELLATKTSELTGKEAEIAEINASLQSAQVEINDALKKVEQLRFSSAEGTFNSLLLPIPQDVRKGNLELAAKRLKTLRDSELNPQFKNGWVARHFAKVVNVTGVEKRLDKDATITQIVHDQTGSLISIGTVNGKPAAWKLDPVAGEAEQMNLDLPDYGRIEQAAISPDGRLLAVALNDVVEDSKFAEPFWLIDLNSGRRLGMPNSTLANQSVVGCQAVGLAVDPASPGTLKLVTVEELSGYNGLKQRLQVAVRSVGLKQNEIFVGAAETTPIAATTRDQGRVSYITTMNFSAKKPTIAIVYASLDAAGRNRLVLETLIASEGLFGSRLSFASQKITLPQYPTAMHVGDNGDLYCGQADGRIDQYSADRLTAKPNRSSNEHESAVTVLISAGNGKLIGGSQDGVLVCFDRDMKFEKRLVGQPDGLTTVSIMETSEDTGFQLASGGSRGYVRIWEPETTLHDASIAKQASAGELRLGGNTTVTCGAVDQDWMPSEVPATAYGTADGRVFYFNSDRMRSRGDGLEISGAENEGPVKMSISPPPGSFDTSFGNFDSFGIVAGQFVLLQSDGKLYSTLIDTKSTEPSSRIRLTDATNGRPIVSRFEPVLATAAGQRVFFTNNPNADHQILIWRSASGTQVFRPTMASTLSRQRGRVKRLKFSNNGEWLAVVREAGRGSTTGEYITEIMSVDLSDDGPATLRVAAVTGRYRVGDPAFVGFSSDSRKLILHFHKSGVDRETWTENWNLEGSVWQQSEPKRRVDERRVDLVGWDGDKTLVTKINKRFYLAAIDSGASNQPLEISTEANRTSRKRLRSVRPVGFSGKQYVLYNQRLERFDDRGVKEENVPELGFINARDVRVFGKQAVVLDDRGFHLVDSDMNYVTMIARRKIATRSLALSQGRLAVTYDIGGLCRIMDVSQTTPAEVGRFDDARQVRLSPDGKWAAVQRNGELQIFNIESKFEQPSFHQPIAAADWAMQWLGTSAPQLLVAIQSADGKQLDWKQVDPRKGTADEPTIQLPKQLGVPGQLVEFAMAPYSRKYVSLLARQGGHTGMALWAVSETAAPVQLGQEQNFDAGKLNPMTISFSELDREDKSAIGTRLMVLNDDPSVSGAGKQARATKIYLLADEQIEDQNFVGLNQGDVALAAPARVEEAPMKTIYRVFEIEGVIEVTDGRQLIDSRFSGDGRTLLEVDDRGVKSLLSKDW